MNTLLRGFRQRLLPDVLIGVILLILPLILFWSVTIGGKTLLPADNLYQYPPWSAYKAQLGVPAVPHNSLLSDLVLENVEWKTFTRQAIATRQIPLWNPYIFAGAPFLAEGQHSALYPFSVIYDILPLDRAYGVFTVSQLWLAGLLMVLFMRGVGARRIGALCAAIVYQLSACFLASVVFPMIIAAAAWLPFLLLMVEFAIQQRTFLGKPAVVPWVVLGAIGLGMCILAGHVEFIYYALLVMGFWTVCRLVPMLLHRQWLPTLRHGLALVTMVALGLGLGAIQFIPLYQLAGQNFRAGSTTFDTVRSYAYPPRHALEYLIPNLYGSPAQHSYLDLFGGGTQPFQWTRPDKTPITDTYWEVNKNYVEGACYVGLFTLILCLIALWDAWRNKMNRFRGLTALLALLAFIAIAFAFGTPLYAILYYGLPGINQLHSPFRWVFPLTFVLAALAGLGADALSRAYELRGAGELSPVSRLTRPLGWGLVIVGGLLTCGLVASRLFYSRFDSIMSSLLARVAGASSQFPDSRTFYSVEFPSFAVLAALLILSGLVLLLSRRSITLPRRLGNVPIWEVLTVIILAADLGIASWGFNPASDPAWLKFTPPAIAWLQNHDPQNWRMITLDGGGENSKPINENAGWLFGLQQVSGYDSIIAKQYVDYMTQIEPQPLLGYNRIAPILPDHLAALDSPQLDQLAVRYVVSNVPIDLTAHPQYKQVFADGGVIIYENSRAYPRAYTLDSDSSAPEPAVLTETGFNQIRIAVPDHLHPVRLILSDSYAPGWRAFVRPNGADDSQEVEIPITLANGNFRQVELPPGNWSVRFQYSPASFQIGAFGSFITAVLLIFSLLVWFWRRFYTDSNATDPAAAQSGGVRRIAKNSGAPVILSLFNRVIDFGFAVVMLRALSPTDVGIYYYAVVVIGWFDILSNFGLNTFLTRDVARNPGAAGFYLRRTSILRLALVLVWLPVLALFYIVRQNVLHPALDTTSWIVIGLLYLSLIPGSLNNGFSALFYAFEKAEIPAAISTGTAIASVILRLAVLVVGWGIIGLAGASFVLNLFTLIVLTSQALPLLRKAAARATPQDRADHAALQIGRYPAMLREAWPLMLNHLLATVFFKIDVTVLEQIKGPDVVARYSVAYKWVDAIGVIPSFFTMAMLPVMSRQAHDDKPGLMRNYQLAVKLLTMIALPIAVVTTFLAPLLIEALGGSRYLPDGARALQLMIWFIPIGWINSLTQYVLIALDLQRPLRWPFIVGVIFNLVANLLFIPVFSFQAASVITILSEIVLQVGFYILLRPALGSIDWAKLLGRIVLSGAVMFGVLLVLWPISSVLGLIVAGITYAIALVGLGALSLEERSRLAPLLPGPMRRLIPQLAWKR